MTTYSARSFGAVGDGATNDTAAIQSAIAARGAGRVEIEPGNYFTPGLTLPPNVTLWGHGAGTTVLQSMNHDSPVITLLPGSFHGLENIGIYGRNDASTQTNTIVISPGVVSATLRDLVVWFGYSAIYNRGIDCCLDNCYIGNSYNGAAIVSNGANWYLRCKIDTLAAALVGGKTNYYRAFLQGDSLGGLMENHFEMCDFSGDYDLSVEIVDATNMSITDFSGCVFSAPVHIGGAHTTVFRGCEFGGSINNTGPGNLILTGNVALTPITAHGHVTAAANVGITVT